MAHAHALARGEVTHAENQSLEPRRAGGDLVHPCERLDFFDEDFEADALGEPEPRL